MLQSGRSEIWKQRLDPYLRRAEQAQPLVVTGKLTRMVGLTLEAVGCQASIGGRCLIESTQGEPIEAEVVGFHGDRLYLMPIGDLHFLAAVRAFGRPPSLTRNGQDASVVSLRAIWG